MTLEELITQAQSLDIKLWTEGDQLGYSAPPGVLTPSFREQLVAHKRELLAFLSEAHAVVETIRPPIEPISRDARLPLSFAQQRLWLLDQLVPNNPAYTIPLVVRFVGRLDAQALEQSINALIQRHEVLRTSFEVVEEQPFQVIIPTLTVHLAIADFSDRSPQEREAEAQQLIDTAVQQPFDLHQAPLLRPLLIRLAGDTQILLITMHHIISDGWSNGIMIRELASFYKAFIGGEHEPLPSLPIQYADFAAWQRRWLQGEALETQTTYWRNQLDNAPPALELPLDYVRPPLQTYRGSSCSTVLSEELSRALKALCQRENATLFMTLLAAFKVLLYRYTGQTDVIVGSPIANRNMKEVETLIGFFINTLTLRTDLSGDPSFQEVLDRVRTVTLGAYAHQDMPFEKLLEELHLERDMSRTPLFQVFFNMLNIPYDRIDMPGVTTEILAPPEVGAKFDLTLYAIEQSDRIRLHLAYNADLFSPERIAEMIEQLTFLLSQIVEQPDARISRYSLVTPLAESVLPNPALPLNSTWSDAAHTRFAQQAQRIPERLAIRNGQYQWTYGALNEWSNRLANYLRAKGVHQQDIVAIYADRSAELVWAMLGILKAGAAFLVLDAAYPVARLLDCLRVATPRAWIQLRAAGTLPDELDDFVSLSYRCRLELPRDPVACRALATYAIDDPGIMVDPEDIAYLAFTSGTMATPKGILGTHRPLSHFLEWHSRTFDLNEHDRFSMLSGLSHDPLLRDIFTPLWLGTTLCIPELEQFGTPGQFAEWMEQERISVAHLTPAMGRLLTGATHEQSLKSLRYAFFGGDVLTQDDLLRIKTAAPAATCVNFYGTTETPQAMAYFVVPREHDDASREIVPLGRGIQDTQLLILSEAQQRAGIGELGEIHIRSRYLARGYLDDEVLTRERFIPNPFGAMRDTRATDTDSSFEDRLYKTGDLGYYTPDGLVVFLGRSDNQVKLRGFRVELGEIEAALRKHPKVSEAVVLMPTSQPDASSARPRDKHLVAYIVPQEGNTLTTSDLSRFLKERLPNYMVPAAFVMLQSLPLTPHGKVDHRALPIPALGRPELAESFEPPRTATEEELVNIWSQVLGFEQIGIYDNFFELGGHSLLAMQVMSRVQQAFQVELPLRSFFENPTVAGLSEVVASSNQDEQEETEVLDEILSEIERLSDDEAAGTLMQEVGGASLDL